MGLENGHNYVVVYGLLGVPYARVYAVLWTSNQPQFEVVIVLT